MPTQYDILIDAQTLSVPGLYRLLKRSGVSLGALHGDSFTVATDDENGILSALFTEGHLWSDSTDARFAGYSHSLRIWVGISNDTDDTRSMALGLAALFAEHLRVAVIYNKEFFMGGTSPGKDLVVATTPFVSDALRSAGFFEAACSLEAGRFRLEEWRRSA